MTNELQFSTYNALSKYFIWKENVGIYPCIFTYTLMDYHLLIRNFSIGQSESLFEIGAKQYSLRLLYHRGLNIFKKTAE